MLQITKYTHVSPVHSEDERKIIRVYVARSLCGFLFLFSCGLKSILGLSQAAHQIFLVARRVKI